ncbi:MAG: tyrosine-type recombinase/integrase [Desulfobacula sp.]|uniref:tyrosine-type recombinase/integrase n=1 Tax=Desulfobacula sp. TaxID=2593537 RepID=UPI001D756B29|nr:tyrosine-type recombinase/integrase [Desulfobacula sp.]MBT4024859.1 tyrosine-type recombinase/integrase [Desulfobacula sp.]MBT6750151.1 tyrosine-type recombinase/integrase [Desulfobacula sp.]MBT7794779.1 tyrosine-type recombinase/integrase [Desulfobacula sp.]
MSLYFVKGKGWRYDFTLKGKRYTETWFKTKREAKQTEAKKKEGIQNPEVQMIKDATPIDMEFLELINRRLDYVQEYNSVRYYTNHIYAAKRWCRLWSKMMCSEITANMIQNFIYRQKKSVSVISANMQLTMLRAMFNFGMIDPRNWISNNPTKGLAFFPVEKKVKYVPPIEDVLKVINSADPDSQDYLWVIACTMGRVSEINRLAWEDVHLKERYLYLYTRKKRGGSLTPRRIAMNKRLHGILSRRCAERDKDKPWVFWHRYWSCKLGEFKEGPYIDRKRLMKILCKHAGVKYFRYHPLRHFGASLLDHQNVPIGDIQRILGHENRKTTEIYLHSIGNSQKDAMDILDEKFEKTEKKVGNKAVI